MIRIIQLKTKIFSNISFENDTESLIKCKTSFNRVFFRIWKVKRLCTVVFIDGYDFYDPTFRIWVAYKSHQAFSLHPRHYSILHMMTLFCFDNRFRNHGRKVISLKLIELDQGSTVGSEPDLWTKTGDDQFEALHTSSSCSVVSSNWIFASIFGSKSGLCGQSDIAYSISSGADNRPAPRVSAKRTAQAGF